MKRIISVLMMLSFLVLIPSPYVGFAEGADDYITYDKPTDAFDYYIDADPMQMTDEEFFGVWSEADQRWSVKPCFDYDRHIGLSEVENSVKLGNYDEAKDNLLAYYRTVQEERSLAPMSHPGAAAIIRSQALEKNVYAVSAQNGFSQGFINVTNDWEEHRIDVLNSFSAATVGRDTYRGFVLMAVDKYLTKAEFYSKDSQYAPTLELTVNGMSVTLPACKDAMVRGGQYGATNYGKDEIMSVQESGEYQDFNENTMRAYIAFDISSLNPTDIVTSATLVLHGRNASGTGEKEIFVYRLNDMSFDEDTIAFDDYTDCMLWSCNDQNTWDFVTSNNAAVKGKACFFHRGNELLIPAQLYRYTGDERYAYTFIRHQMGLVNHVGFSTSVFNALDIAGQLRVGTESLMHILQSEYLTGEIFTAMLKTFWLQADYLANKYYGTATNNWGSFATCGVFALISRFSELAVYDSWMEKTKTENTRLVGGFTYEDGMCIELSQSYIMTILNTLQYPVVISNETGVKLPYTDEVMEQAHNIVRSLIYCSSPGFKGYNIADGNDYTSSITNSVKNWYSIFPDDSNIEYVVTGGTHGLMPENPTTNYPFGLRTYMRSSWDDDALAMSFTAKGDGSHGHYDKLSVTMYAYGRFLLVDPSYGGVLTGDIRDYMISAQQHNLVTVNGKNQTVLKSDGEQLAYESNSLYDFIDYGGEMIAGSYQSRNVLFLKNQKFWIIGDYVAPDDKETQNLYEQHWHMLPAANMTVDDITKVIQSNFSDFNVTLVPIGADDLNARQEDSVFSSAGGVFEDSKKTVLEKNQSGDAVFSTIVLPRDLNEDFEVDTDVLATGIDSNIANAFRCKIKNLKTNITYQYYYYHLNDVNQKQKVNVGRFSTDATTMLIQTDDDGKIVSVFLMDATVLEDNTLTDKVLFYSKTPVKAFAYEQNGDLLTFFSSSVAEDDLKDITVYSANKKAAKLNGSWLDTKISGGYMYFGDEPLVEGSEPTPDNSQKPSQGQTRPIGGGGGGGTVVTPPVKEEDKTGAEDITPISPTPVVPTPKTPSYDDVAESDWYFDYVEELTEKEIVSGDGTGNFAPNNNVTREQFLKMLLVAAEIETDVTENTFTDVSTDDWFAQYVLTAKNLGIVNGISDTTFGIGSNITRQDMAVMISRTIEKLALQIDAEKVDVFEDDAKVSDYAKESVTFMKSIGLIEGYNNEFRPLDNLTRAEAAKVISELLKLI